MEVILNAKPKRRPIKAYWWVVLAISVSFSALAVDSTEEFRRALVQVQLGTNINTVEEHCATLLKKHHNSSEDTGKIYLALVLNNTYRTNGASKIIDTSQKSLQFPLDVNDACRAYESLGEGLRMKMMSGRHSGREESVIRKEILGVYLHALKLVLSNATTLIKQEVPGVASYHYAGSGTNDPVYMALRQRHLDQVKVHDAVVAANGLVDQYERFKSYIVDLYRGIPFPEEILQEGQKIMPSASVVNELIEEVKRVNKPPTAVSDQKLVR